MRRLQLIGLALFVALVVTSATLADNPVLIGMPGSITVNVENVTSGTASWTDPTAQNDVGDPLPVSCSPSSGSSFPLGTTSVACTATDAAASQTAQGSFSVTVVDPTSPVLTLPTVAPVSINGAATATVTYTATADDAGPIPISCAPASGSPFPLGTTHVSCSATDGAGNTTNGGFDVIVQDTTPPTISVPGNITQSVNGATTKVVTFSATASDGGTPLTPSCAPASGSAFPLGTTTVNCSVADAAGNPASGSFSVTVQDTTPPSVSIGGAPSGTVNTRDASISFSASEGSTSCSLDGGGFSGCGSPASYSGLADGGHTFTVRATDAASNSSTASASWTVDATPPTISTPSSAIVVEADGPSGATATYSVSAADAGAPLAPSGLHCSPPSGALFPLGDTAVECNASDGHGNTSRAQFHVNVRDTTPPAINAPDVSVTATGTAGIHKTDPALANYISHVTTSDLVSTPKLTNTIPDVLPVGARTVTFTATDEAGNVATKRAVITVLAQGKVAPPPDFKPPANPARVVAKPGDGKVDLSWTSAADVTYVTVVIYAPGSGGAGKIVYRGSAGKFTAKGLKNGSAYRFVLIAWDKAGNRSKGAVVRATPKVELLLAPTDKQRVAKPPLLRWAPSAGSSYYNVQLWRGKDKVLSIWPSAAHLQLTAGWTFDGKKQKLTPGTYTWYVWPGLGPRAAARYGPLLGSHTFVVGAKTPAV